MLIKGHWNVSNFGGPIIQETIPIFNFVSDKRIRRVNCPILGLQNDLALNWPGRTIIYETSPPIPLDQRGCRFCGPPGPRIAIGSPGRGPVDDELHAITACSLMAAERSELYQQMSNINPRFGDLNCQQKFVRLMCPICPSESKYINKFISITFKKRQLLDEK